MPACNRVVTTAAAVHLYNGCARECSGSFNCSCKTQVVHMCMVELQCWRWEDFTAVEPGLQLEKNAAHLYVATPPDSPQIAEYGHRACRGRRQARGSANNHQI